MEIDWEVACIALTVALIGAVVGEKSCENNGRAAQRTDYLVCLADHPAEVCAPLAPGRADR